MAMVYCESCGRAASTAAKIRHESCKDPTLLASTDGEDVSASDLLGPFSGTQESRAQTLLAEAAAKFGKHVPVIPSPEPGKDRFAKTAADLHTRILANRERLCEAWIAETGLKPSESVLVQRQMEDGSIRIWVEPRRVSHNDKSAYECDVAELRRYREREPLVQELVSDALTDFELGQNPYDLIKDAERVRDFGVLHEALQRREDGEGER